VQRPKPKDKPMLHTPHKWHEMLKKRWHKKQLLRAMLNHKWL
jgi:hypothetical protein